jgi:hypothetical protein
MVDTKIPAFRVRVTDGGGSTVTEKTFTDGPGTDQAFLDHQYGPDTWDRIRVRQKTNEGHMHVVVRQWSNSAQFTDQRDASPAQPVECQNPKGQLFRITVEKLDEAQWKAGQAMKFKAPSAEIVGDAGGWWVTFRPQQWPCVCTLAVDAHGTKDEALPSFPFPSSPKHAEGRFYIAKGQFMTAEGGTVRLGVRGTGMMVRVALPAAGETATVKPAHFKSVAHAQPELLTDQYVLGKYNEKSGQVQYT